MQRITDWKVHTQLGCANTAAPDMSCLCHFVAL